MGVVFVLVMLRGDAGWQRAAPFLMPGLLGGFTTFSAFSLETFQLIERGRLAAAGAYVGGSAAVGVLALCRGRPARARLADGMSGVSQLVVQAERRGPAARPLAAPTLPAPRPGPDRAHVPQGRDPGRRRPRAGLDPSRRRPDRCACRRSRRTRTAPAPARAGVSDADAAMMRAAVHLPRRRHHRASTSRPGLRPRAARARTATWTASPRRCGSTATTSPGWCTGSTATPRACCCSRRSGRAAAALTAPSSRATRARSTGRSSPACRIRARARSATASSRRPATAPAARARRCASSRPTR